MCVRLRPLLIVLAVVATARSSHAAEPEKEVVRNRLYSPKGTFEVGVDLSAAIIERLVSTTNIQVVGAYNITNEWAAELMAGYAVSGLTAIANQVSSQVASEPVSTTPAINDFSGLWQIKWNVMAGARWAPIYGKLSLSSDLSVHFQAYLALGVGAIGVSRTSVVYCLQPSGQDTSGDVVCPDALQQSRVAPGGEFGGGLSFFLPYNVELKLEARDYIFPDQYQINIQRAEAESGDTTAGESAPSPGLENTVFMTVGLAYVF